MLIWFSFHESFFFFFNVFVLIWFTTLGGFNICATPLCMQSSFGSNWWSCFGILCRFAKCCTFPLNAGPRPISSSCTTFHKHSPAWLSMPDTDYIVVEPLCFLLSGTYWPHDTRGTPSPAIASRLDNIFNIWKLYFQYF